MGTIYHKNVFIRIKWGITIAIHHFYQCKWGRRDWIIIFTFLKAVANVMYISVVKREIYS